MHDRYESNIQVPITMSHHAAREGRMFSSDIPVHMEQAPSDTLYFDPLNAEALADILWKKAMTYDPSYDLTCRMQAKEQLPNRWRSFGNAYSDIVIDALRY